MSDAGFRARGVVGLLAGLAAPVAGQDCQWINTGVAGPPARLETSLAYDLTRHRLVLFGGWGPNGGSVFLGDTWEWDGAAWHLVSTTGPAARRGAGLAYDEARNVTVLYSGLNSGSFVDTWEWNGSAWTDVSSGLAGVRINPVMVFDRSRGRVVVYGGEGFTLGTASEWTGSTWNEFATGGPVNSRWYGTFNAATNRVLITQSGGTYELNGTVWQQVGPGTSTYLLAFDTVRNRVFGRASGEMREWNGTSWSVLTTLIPGEGSGSVASRIVALGFDVALERGIALRSTLTYLWNGSGARPLMVFTQPPLTQVLPLGGNASFTVAVNVPPPLTYQWYRGNTALVDDGRVAGSQTSHLTISNIVASDYSAYTVVATDECGSSAATSGIEPPASGMCYPNCDGSTTFPYLNANDFQCFLGAYASGNTRANCDGSTTQPILNANDFQCFMNAYAAGCTAP